MERAPRHIVRDLGAKLAADVGGATMRTIVLAPHPQDGAEIIDIGMAPMLAVLIGAISASYPSFTEAQAGDAVVDSVRRLVDRALADEKIVAQIALARAIG